MQYHFLLPLSREVFRPDQRDICNMHLCLVGCTSWWRTYTAPSASLPFFEPPSSIPYVSTSHLSSVFSFVIVLYLLDCYRYPTRVAYHVRTKETMLKSHNTTGGSERNAFQVLSKKRVREKSAYKYSMSTAVEQRFLKAPQLCSTDKPSSAWQDFSD